MQYMKLDAPAQQTLLAELGTMPAWLAAQFADLPSAEAAARPADGAFAPVEQVWHLADLEAEGFGYRIARLLDTERPELPDFDGAAIADARDYRSRSLEEGLERFAAARRATLATLASVPAGAWARAGVQAGVGPITLCDMPLFLAQHDAAHREEIIAWARSAAHRRR